MNSKHWQFHAVNEDRKPFPEIEPVPPHMEKLSGRFGQFLAHITFADVVWTIALVVALAAACIVFDQCVENVKVLNTVTRAHH